MLFIPGNIFMQITCFVLCNTSVKPLWNDCYFEVQNWTRCEVQMDWSTGIHTVSVCITTWTWPPGSKWCLCPLQPKPASDVLIHQNPHSIWVYYRPNLHQTSWSTRIHTVCDCIKIQNWSIRIHMVSVCIKTQICTRWAMMLRQCSHILYSCTNVCYNSMCMFDDITAGHHNHITWPGTFYCETWTKGKDNESTFHPLILTKLKM